MHGRDDGVPAFQLSAYCYILHPSKTVCY